MMTKMDIATPNSDARLEKKREIEAKLILSSHFKGWTVAENFIAEKNVRHARFEFGYAAGISRPLALAGPERCNLCPENFQVGVEMYCGLGTYEDFGIRGTSVCSANRRLGARDRYHIQSLSRFRCDRDERRFVAALWRVL